MNGCDVQASGAVELYFYDELDPAQRVSIETHVSICAECRRAFEELSVIRAALASRPRVDAPLDGDWSAFMIRLDEAIRIDHRGRQTAAVMNMPERAAAARPTRRLVVYAPYAAMAALLALVTSTVVYFARTSPVDPNAPSHTVEVAPPSAATPATDSTARVEPVSTTHGQGFAALSEQHFERSKLVVLGLANKDAKALEADWAFERGLASSLLDDTRLYRMAAEDRGMTRLAGVMGDLELVLLQTSLADKPDPDTLQRIQRLIHKRDLVTKMDVATTGS